VFTYQQDEWNKCKNRNKMNGTNGRTYFWELVFNGAKLKTSSYPLNPIFLSVTKLVKLVTLINNCVTFFANNRKVSFFCQTFGLQHCFRCKKRKKSSTWTQKHSIYTYAAFISFTNNPATSFFLAFCIWKRKLSYGYFYLFFIWL